MSPRGKVQYRDVHLTVNQWRRALSALDNLLVRTGKSGDDLFRAIPTEWERQALWILRGQLLLASADYAPPSADDSGVQA